MMNDGMGQWWTAQDTAIQFYWSLTAVSTLLALLQAVMALVHPQRLEEDEQRNALFNWWAIVQVLVVVAMACGWIGVGIYYFRLPWPVALGYVIAGGILITLGFGYLLHMVHGGSPLPGMEWMYVTGKVSQSIPPNQNGHGKVLVKVGGRGQEWEAVTDDGLGVPAGSPIRVVEMIDQRLLLVERVREGEEGPRG